MKYASPAKCFPYERSRPHQSAVLSPRSRIDPANGGLGVYRHGSAVKLRRSVKRLVALLREMKQTDGDDWRRAVRRTPRMFAQRFGGQARVFGHCATTIDNQEISQLSLTVFECMTDGLTLPKHAGMVPLPSWGHPWLIASRERRATQDPPEPWKYRPVLNVQRRRFRHERRMVRHPL